MAKNHQNQPHPCKEPENLTLHPKHMLRARAKRGRAPLWPVLLVPLVMTATAMLVALITGTVIGFALAAVYSAGSFTMST